MKGLERRKQRKRVVGVGEGKIEQRSDLPLSLLCEKCFVPWNSEKSGLIRSLK